MATMSRPRLIFADEPTPGLQPVAARAILAEPFRELADPGCAVVLITQRDARCAGDRRPDRDLPRRPDDRGGLPAVVQRRRIPARPPPRSRALAGAAGQRVPSGHGGLMLHADD